MASCKFFGPTPTHEIDYTGQLPDNVPATFATLKEFATDLAAQTNLKIVYEHEGFGGWINFKTDPKGEIDLTTPYKRTFSGKDNVTVYLSIYEAPTRQIRILTCGDIDIPDAKVIAAKMEELFAKKYSGYKLVRFVRYQGLAP